MISTKTPYTTENCFEVLIPEIRELAVSPAETEKLWGKINEAIAKKRSGLFNLQDADIENKIVR